jgi:2'-hydroxyisoflavone reductase
MDVLILGGTRFIGPHIVETLRGRGHEVTLFNRGETDAERFDDLEQLRGDREAGDYAALEGGSWDAVVDTSAYYPRAVRQALDSLRGDIGHYLLISTVSVYRDFEAETIDEDYPLADPDELDDPATEEVDSETYGPLKVACERVARDRGPGRVTILRPPVIAGPGDPTDRFTYWPVRVADGGTVLAPDDPEWPMQYVDVRDLADWGTQCLEDRRAGTFNTAFPAGQTTWGTFLDICRELSGSDADFEWVDRRELEEAGVDGWTDLPLWAPRRSSMRGMAGISSEWAQVSGMTFRKTEQTVRDTLEWFRAERGGGRADLGAGLPAEREREILGRH